jgi:alpha-ribazole phosphatase
MEIYLIRHTSVAIEKSICYGQSEVELATSFDAELVSIREKVPQEDFVVYSSPLGRCLKLATSFGKRPSIDPRLMELHFGDWELKDWDEIPVLELSRWMNDFVNCACPNGESYQQLYERSSAFFEELMQASHPAAIIVTHSGVIRSILSYVLSVPLEKSFAFQFDYGKISKISCNAQGLKVVEYVNL